MKKVKIFITLILAPALFVSLAGCFAVRPEVSRTVSYEDDTGYEEEFPEEYPVSDYKTEGDVFKTKGKLNKYVYEQVPDAEKVIDILNDEFDIELEMDSDIEFYDGYGNWFYSSGEDEDDEHASVSMSRVTGKFCFSLKPEMSRIVSAEKVKKADVNELKSIADSFVSKFEYITGKLTMETDAVADDLFYTQYGHNGEVLENINVGGRRFYYASGEYSKKTLEAQEGLDCYIDCGDSSLEDRECLYFVVTLWNDGTVVAADNYITKADIVPDGTIDMPDESGLSKITQYFSSTTENDTLIIKSIYMDSYSNYFGYPRLDPMVKIEYALKSSPKDIMTTEIVIEGLID